MPSHPNIVYIFADDLGYGDLGCYGSQKIPTPHIDRIASEGMRFTDAHSCSAVCTPSRYGLLTGRYCWRSPLQQSVLRSYEPPLIEYGRSTVGSILKSVGYHCSAIGKWHLGLEYSCKPGCFLDFERQAGTWPLASRSLSDCIDFSQPLGGGPISLGFDSFFGTSACSTSMPPYAFIEGDRWLVEPSEYLNDGITPRPGPSAPGWRHDEVDTRFTERAVEEISGWAASDQPHFLYLAASAPHEPCMPEAVPSFARGKSQAGSRGDLIWLFDWMCGEVYHTLEETGQLDNTWLIISSDNGALPGDLQNPDSAKRSQNGYEDYGHKSNGDWRGYKSHIWEGGHRVPLIMRWPERIPAGSTNSGVTDLLDLCATAAAITGAEIPPGQAEDSIDISCLLRGDGPSPREFIIHHSIWGVFALRQGNWKVIFETEGSGGYPWPKGEGPEMGTAGQIYNISEDPQEEHNLWHSRPDIVALFSERMMQARRSS